MTRAEAIEALSLSRAHVFTRQVSAEVRTCGAVKVTFEVLHRDFRPEGTTHDVFIDF
jgi:hypothetical protein